MGRGKTPCIGAAGAVVVGGELGDGVWAGTGVLLQGGAGWCGGSARVLGAAAAA
jgi:hypothetical protein